MHFGSPYKILLNFEHPFQARNKFSKKIANFYKTIIYNSKPFLLVVFLF